jgi:two-component system cell cycle sensor histidine kinase/response regulator CckA
MTPGPVLILDDNAGVLELTSLFLRQSGFTPVTCSSAESAFEALRATGGYAAVLVADVSLAHDSGAGIAVQLRALAPGLKVLFVSGYSFEDWLRTDLALLQRLPSNAIRFLRQPFTAKELVDQLDELLGDVSGRSEAARHARGMNCVVSRRRS